MDNIPALILSVIISLTATLFYKQFICPIIYAICVLPFRNKEEKKPISKIFIIVSLIIIFILALIISIPAVKNIKF